MALYYRTEYRIGNRGRICRSYTGLAAFGAIVFDLGFGLIFELVTAVIGLSLRLVCMALCGRPPAAKIVEHACRRSRDCSRGADLSLRGAP